MNETQVLLIEDDPVLGGALLQRLRLEGLSAQWVQSCAQAVEWFRRSRQRPAFVLADIRLPDGSGEDLYRRLIPHLAQATVVFATAYGEIAQAVRLVAAGANDYLTKPYDTDALVARMRAVIAAQPVGSAREVHENPFALDEPASPLAHDLERLAASDLPLLLEGETGTGKDRAARYAHARSPFAAGPFVAVNCASLPPDLAESLLVGFFLAGLVVLGGMQQWWLQPIVSGLEPRVLFFGALALTAVTDNAALTYLGSLIDGISAQAQYMLVAGAVAGGGLTVIANAPNPAGVALLRGGFNNGAVSMPGLLAGALAPTVVAASLLFLL